VVGFTTTLVHSRRSRITRIQQLHPLPDRLTLSLLSMRIVIKKVVAGLLQRCFFCLPISALHAATSQSTI
jgi:hypothetical protein